VAPVTFSELAIVARRALLDAFEALEAHRDALVLVGAQAIYLYTGDVDVQVATTTKDSDLVIIPDRLGNDPLIAAALEGADFYRDLEGHQGKWLSADGVPVDLMVPQAYEDGTHRGARIPPHDKRDARRVRGLEAAAVDYQRSTIRALDQCDQRVVDANVAGPGALVVAKMHKIGERATEAQRGARDRREDKDAHDVYRLLSAVESTVVVSGIMRGLAAEISADVTAQAIAYLRDLAATPDGTLCVMAGRAESEVGDPEEVASRTWALVQETLDLLDVERGEDLTPDPA
jgi:hypothetical protein